MTLSRAPCQTADATLMTDRHTLTSVVRNSVQLWVSPQIQYTCRGTNLSPEILQFGKWSSRVQRLCELQRGSVNNSKREWALRFSFQEIVHWLRAYVKLFGTLEYLSNRDQLQKILIHLRNSVPTTRVPISEQHYAVWVHKTFIIDSKWAQLTKLPISSLVHPKSAYCFGKADAGW